MRRSLPLGMAAILSVSLAAPVAAQDTVDRIELPDGWEPEGITTDGTSLFVGSLADGAIWRADPTTGEGEVLVGGRDDTVSVGMDVAADGTLWVAGGPSGSVRAYDSATGELIASYAIEAGFLNDVAATPDAIYVTDSFMPQLVVVPLADGVPPEADGITSLPISGELTYDEGFNLNGIVAHPAGLISVHGAQNALFLIDPSTGEATRIDTGDIELTSGDGIEPDGSTLHIMRNRANTVTSLELDESATSATLLAERTSDDFDVPATIALLGDDLWAANARFGSASEDDQAYWISRLGIGGADG